MSVFYLVVESVEPDDESCMCVLQVVRELVVGSVVDKGGESCCIVEVDSCMCGCMVVWLCVLKIDETSHKTR